MNLHIHVFFYKKVFVKVSFAQRLIKELDRLLPCKSMIAFKHSVLSGLYDIYIFY